MRSGCMLNYEMETRLEAAERIIHESVKKFGKIDRKECKIYLRSVLGLKEKTAENYIFNILHSSGTLKTKREDGKIYVCEVD